MAWTFYNNGVAKTGSNASLDNIGDVDVSSASDGSLLRFEATGLEWRDTTNLFLDDNGQLQLTTGGVTGGLLLGGNANLYSAGASIVATDGQFRAKPAAPTNNAFQTIQTGDTISRFTFDGNGLLSWGPGGAGALDVTLSRSTVGVLAMGPGDKIQQSAVPTVGDDLTNKTYVDSVARGLDWKDSVRAATTANITLSAPQTIDGVSVIAGNRVLVKNQSTGSQNGIYDVAAGAWTRSVDADISAEVSAGMTVFVSEGTTQGNQTWALTTDDPITLGTTALVFAQVGGGVSFPIDFLSDVDTTGVVDGSLLRYEATGTVWNDTSTLLYSDAGQLQATTTGSAAGVLIGGDFQIYRSAANVGSLGTGDKLQADPLPTVANDLTNQVYVDRVNFFMGT